MNLSANEVSKLFKVIEEENLSISEVIYLIKSNSKNGKENLTDEMTLIIDYSRTLQEMINFGNYDSQNVDITEKNFPLPIKLSGKKITVSAGLFHFNHAITSDNAIFKMKKIGYRPANLAELLALGEAYPNLQKEFPIVALGSVWYFAGVSPSVPVLTFNDNLRKITRFCFNLGWLDSNCFLGVRK